MDRRLIRSSQRLSEPRIAILAGGYTIEVFWFRVMGKTGDWFIRRHAHSTYEFHFCAGGECLVETDSSSFAIREGLFYLSAPGVYHAQRSVNGEEFIEYSLNCNIFHRPDTPDALERELEQVLSVLTLSPCFPAADRFGALALFNQALEEAEQRRIGYEWSLHSLVPRILVAAARAIVLEQPPPSPRTAGAETSNGGIFTREDNRMALIEEYIRTNIREDISPGDIAQHLNLSEKQVSRIVFSGKGFSTKKFITRTKLNRAKELLAAGNMPIKQVAEDLGFSSEYYFNSVFKLHVGVPPGVFRDSMRQDFAESKNPAKEMSKNHKHCHSLRH